MKQKTKKHKPLDIDETAIWEKLTDIFDEHGSLNTFKALLKGIRDTEYEDLTIQDVIECLFKRSKQWSYLEYLNEDDFEQIAEDMDLFGNYKTFKVENISQEIRLENFLSDIQENPCQLKLIA